MKVTFTANKTTKAKQKKLNTFLPPHLKNALKTGGVDTVEIDVKTLVAEAKKRSKQLLNPLLKK